MVQNQRKTTPKRPSAAAPVPAPATTPPEMRLVTFFQPRLRAAKVAALPVIRQASRLSNRVQIASATSAGGRAGSVAVEATAIWVGAGGRISSDANPGAMGEAGAVTVAADDVVLGSGGEISAGTAGPGDGCDWWGLFGAADHDPRAASEPRQAPATPATSWLTSARRAQHQRGLDRIWLPLLQAGPMASFRHLWNGHSFDALAWPGRMIAASSSGHGRLRLAFLPVPRPASLVQCSVSRTEGTGAASRQDRRRRRATEFIGVTRPPPHRRHRARGG